MSGVVTPWGIPTTNSGTGSQISLAIKTYLSTTTGNFRENLGADIIRFNDRLFLGSSTVNDGNSPNVVKDWMTALVNWPVYNATLAVVSPVGQIAGTFGSQTLNLNTTAANSNQTTIGISGFAFANNTGAVFPTDFWSAYASYFEARVYPGTLSEAYGSEINAINLRSSAVGTSTPYKYDLLSAVHGLRIASGGGQSLVVQPALVALDIVNNGAAFTSGIVFGKNSLVGADGTTGFGTALSLGKGHRIIWYYDNGVDGAEAAYITSTATKFVGSIQFQNTSALFLSETNAASFVVNLDGTPTRYLGVTAKSGTEAPILQTFGSDANINLAIKPKGAGQIELTSPVQTAAVFGSATALPATPLTYLKLTLNGVQVCVPCYNIA